MLLFGWHGDHVTTMYPIFIHVSIVLFCWLLSQIAVCKAVIAGNSLSLVKQDLVIGTGSVSIENNYLPLLLLLLLFNACQL